MIKVLDKAFRVLEYVGGRRGEAVAPGEVASALGMNHPTCVRIMRDLLFMGYLDQVSRQKGYVLGCMPYWLTGGGRYRGELSEQADALVRECARELGQSVLLAVNNNERRHILSHYNYNSRLKVDVSAPWYDDMLETATGRLLLAFMPEAERAATLKTALSSHPAHAWEGMDDDLSWRIRAEGRVCFEKPGMVIAAYPVYRDGVFAAALGMSTPRDEVRNAGDVEKLTGTLEAYARKISEKISMHSSIG